MVLIKRGGRIMKPYVPKKLPVLDQFSIEVKLFEKRAANAIFKLEKRLIATEHHPLYHSLLLKEESFHSLKKVKKVLSKTEFYQYCSKNFPHEVNPDYQEIVNYLNAFTYAMKQKRVSKKLFFILHQEIKKGNLGKKQKNFQYRKHQNWIGKEGCKIEDAYFLPPKAEQVPLYMKNLIAYLNEKQKNPLIQLAIGFAQFLIIHPFMDGNGRVARAIVPFFFRQKKILSAPILCISSYIKRKKLDYFRLLYLITQKQDWQSWILYFLKAINSSANQLIKRIDELNAIYFHLVARGVNQSFIHLLFNEVVILKKTAIAMIGRKEFNRLVREELIEELGVSSLVSIKGMIPKIKHK
jgi:Fic family protein